jgi:hypothetical protein
VPVSQETRRVRRRAVFPRPGGRIGGGKEEAMIYFVTMLLLLALLFVLGGTRVLV